MRAKIGAVSSKTLTVNKNFWNALDSAVQAILQDVAAAYRDRLAEVAMSIAGESEAAYVAAGGVITELPDDQRAAWAAATPNIALEWATGRQGRLGHAGGLHRKVDRRRGNPGAQLVHRRLTAVQPPRTSAEFPNGSAPARAVHVAARLMAGVAHVVNAAGTLVVLGLVVLINSDVIPRNAFNAPFRGTYEAVQFLW